MILYLKKKSLQEENIGVTKEKLLRTLDILKTTDEQHPVTTAKIIEHSSFFKWVGKKKISFLSHIVT